MFPSPTGPQTVPEPLLPNVNYAFMSHLSQGLTKNMNTNKKGGDQQQRPKKQMNFSSRQEMIKYIENFRINYKTELCKNFMKTGTCEFQGECAYAHGYVELVVK